LAFSVCDRTAQTFADGLEGKSVCHTPWFTCCSLCIPRLQVKRHRKMGRCVWAGVCGQVCVCWLGPCEEYRSCACSRRASLCLSLPLFASLCFSLPLFASMKDSIEGSKHAEGPLGPGIQSFMPVYFYADISPHFKRYWKGKLGSKLASPSKQCAKVPRVLHHASHTLDSHGTIPRLESLLLAHRHCDLAQEYGNKGIPICPFSAASMKCT